MKTLDSASVTFAHLGTSIKLDMKAIHAEALATLRKINVETRPHAPMA